MTEPPHREILEFLLSPSSYGAGCPGVDHIETHISHVFVAGDHVYKMKKPVRFDFLDFSTLALREADCHEEVRLNRRLAPDLYLGVTPVTRHPSRGLALGGEGVPVEWLVHMRRAPVERTLDRWIESSKVTVSQIEGLGQVLERFYKEVGSCPLTEQEYVERFVRHVQSNRKEILNHKLEAPSVRVKRVHAYQLQQLHLFPERFYERVRRGRVVDGHGDLRPEHICLSDPPMVFDCLEFSPEFRQIDVLDELAFLAAECDFLHASWIGNQLLDRFAAAEYGETNELIAFYKSYRACVRAKVAALRSDQLEGAEHARFVEEAKRRLEFADEYVGPFLQPLVIVVSGLSGSGKSTLATKIAETLGAELIRSDVVREEMQSTVKSIANRYSQEMRQEVYRRVFDRASEVHHEKIPVVLDATFLKRENVEAAAKVARMPRSKFVAIECVCSEETALDRIRVRASLGADPSEATAEVFRRQKTEWEPRPSGVTKVQVHTEQPIHIQLEPIWNAIRDSNDVRDCKV